MDYSYSYNYSAQAPQVSPVVWIIYLAIMVLEIVAIWKLFVKAGKPGWASIIPVYNILVMLEIAKKEWWYLLLMLIPFVNFVIAIIVNISFVKAYGKSTGYAVLALFFAPIIYPIMAFGDTQYQG